MLFEVFKIPLALLLVCLQVDSQFIRGGFTINDNLYSLRWEVYHGFITFRAIGRGTGYIGFGMSPKGTMEGSDLFISGMHDNGTVYSLDAHGAVEKDEMSNYELLYLTQGSMYTEVHFRRPLHTGDCKNDIAIMNEPQYVIWSLGPEMDKMETHGTMNRGAVLVNLLNPPMFHAQYYTPDKKPASPPMMCMEMNAPMDGDKGMPAGDDKPAENAVES